MQKLLFFAIIVLFSACRFSKSGSGNIITQTRTVGEFKNIKTAGSVEVDISKGAVASVTVETDDNIMPYVETEVSGGTLKIRLKEINNLRNSNVYVHVVVPELNGLDASAGSEIESKDVISCNDKIELEASSGSKIDVQLDAPSVTAVSSSGAEINARGRTKNSNAEASSGASVNISGLQAENAGGSASSGASVRIFASVSVNGSASSGGEVHYTGGAAKVVKNESSGGSVSPN